MFYVRFIVLVFIYSQERETFCPELDFAIAIGVDRIALSLLTIIGKLNVRLFSK